ncbi:MAG TPA: DUF4089 domain-containing protein [Oscillatoriales cyanobacterium M59_W2019_021]|nr:MAG: DUF4089 domain-containing protein [Cyanobacteria bacterium J055]HIK34009.1 DUF4089 domain-containing protein [Oscillatoriales cyanobacterium M4454_W2019_049]HIK50265.1 DUF4089 domain-containing protein [Oscillatoriales cyanobacterium M59_W2019_021]
MNAETIYWHQFIEQMSNIIDLPIAPESEPGVVENLQNIAEVAALVTEFSLPESIELAPQFTP